MGLSGSQTGTDEVVLFAWRALAGHGFFCFVLGSYGTVGTGGMLLDTMYLLYTRYAFGFYVSFVY